MNTRTTLHPDLTIDTRGRRCPLPVLEATRAADGLPRGALLEVISDCPGAHADLQAWARQTGRELIEVAEHVGGGRVYVVRMGDRTIEFSENCTPGYYNNEGKPSERSLQDANYGAGPVAFFKVLEDWRADGTMEGLELS